MNVVDSEIVSWVSSGNMSDRLRHRSTDKDLLETLFRQFFECLQNFFGVLLYIDFWENVRYLSVFVDDVGHSLRKKTSNSLNALGFDCFLVVIAQDGEG